MSSKQNIDKPHKTHVEKCPGALADPRESYGKWAYWRKGESGWRWYAAPAVSCPARDPKTGTFTRQGINRGRSMWRAVYFVPKTKSRAVGQLYCESRKIRNFDVKIGADKVFRVDIGTGSGVKINFQH